MDQRFADRIRRKWAFYMGSLVWFMMIRSIKLWVNRYMDQFEVFRFKSSYGYDTYVNISYHSEWPDAHEDLDNPRGWLERTEQQK